MKRQSWKRSQGMDSRIRAATAVNADAFLEDSIEGPLDHILDGIAGRLTLPAGEGSAIVSTDTFPAHQ